MSFAYGNKVPRYMDQPNDVIGGIEKSAAGNLVFRVGTVNPDGESWSQDKHVVLTPEEIGLFLNQINEVMNPDPQVVIS